MEWWAHYKVCVCYTHHQCFSLALGFSWCVTCLWIWLVLSRRSSELQTGDRGFYITTGKTHTHKHAHTDTNTHKHTQAHRQTCTNALTQTRTYTNAHTHKRAHNALTQTHTNAHTNKRTDRFTQTCTRTNTQRHKHRQAQTHKHKHANMHTNTRSILNETTSLLLCNIEMTAISLKPLSMSDDVISFRSQVFVISRNDHLPGSHVHIIVVLRHRCHTDRRNDLQVHRVSRVCCHGSLNTDLRSGVIHTSH